MNFYQFWDKLNGEPYSDMPAPVKYDLQDYSTQITSNPISNREGGNADLTPLTDEDMGRYADDDVKGEYLRMHNGKNPLLLGKPMTDGQFKKFLGQTW